MAEKKEELEKSTVTPEETVPEFILPKLKNALNGRAFEYAIASEYQRYLSEKGIKTKLVDNSAMRYAKLCFESFEEDNPERKAFSLSARSTIDTMVKLEPGLMAPKNEKDIISIRISTDSEGAHGDVRDVIFSRSGWEVGFSAKNNNDDVKHSRLSMTIDFGEQWMSHPVSDQYKSDITPAFTELSKLKDEGKKWNEVENKADRFYKPILIAFKNEILRLASQYDDVPEKLILYLLGRYPFYKIIKYDADNLVVVKAFNINGELNKKVNGVSSKYKTPRVNLPSRIVELDWKRKAKGELSDNTLDMILDKGWEISFRIHSAEGNVTPSLKFAIQLLGNPPVLFTQYIFKEDE